MPRRQGEMSPRRAAKVLGVHRDTIYRWCRETMGGKETMLDEAVRADDTGHYYLDAERVKDIADNW